VTGHAFRLELDGFGCPMAHCNRNDDSFHDLPPLRAVETAQKIVDPVVSPRASVHLGAFTGEKAAVCAYDSVLHPALVAYDYRSGAVLWTSPLEDLPGLFQRWPSGILLARVVRGDGTPQHCVFAANPVEFVAYSADGHRLWKRATSEVSAGAPNGVGMPTSLTFSDAHELVCVTTSGWIVKLNPLDGTVIASYRMDASVFVNGREYRGTFTTTKSPVVIGRVLYVLADFKPNGSYPPLHPFFSPVHLLRIELDQPGVRGAERLIKPMMPVRGPHDEAPDRVRLGVYKGTGSPPALVRPGESPILFAHAHTLTATGLEPTINAVEDRQGVLSIRWRSQLHVAPGDDIYAAPALHADSATLLVTTLQKIYVFREVSSLAGQVLSPPATDPVQLVPDAPRSTAASVKVGSPFALAFDADHDEIVVYTNFRMGAAPLQPSYGFLGAFALPVRARTKPRALWQRPLGVTRDGAPIPGFGTFGQPALFRYDASGEQATGVIVNTVATGTYIFR
jgi:hypothetical protein